MTEPAMCKKEKALTNTWRTGRDVKTVHRAVQALPVCGVLDKISDAKIDSPSDVVRVDFWLQAA